MKDLYEFGYKAAEEQKRLNELADAENEVEIGENGEHDCNVDWEESAGHIDGTDGTCMACGKTGLL